MKNIIYTFIAFLTFTSFLVIGCSKKTPHYELSRFIPPDFCGACHGGIYDQWHGSMHNLSLKDVIYQELALQGLEGLTDKDEIAEAEVCQKCHVPVGYISGFPKKTSDDITKIADIAKEGIQCDYCHSITGAYKIYNARFKFDPGRGDADPGIKRGPRNDAESDFHGVAYSEFHKSSELCGTCHNVKHEIFGTWLDTTYQEWEKSPYSKEGVQCQDCHMYQRPGEPGTGLTARGKNPGSSTSGSKERDHIFTHYFIGGNSVIPGMGNDSARVKMAEERLKRAVIIDMDSTTEGNNLVVRLNNKGAGHDVPTGVSNMRQVWLQVKAVDSKGKTVFESGVPDKKGYLGDEAVVFVTKFGDGKGNPVDNIAKAREILHDKRLKAGEEHIEKFDLGDIKGKLKVTASLNYRTIPQDLADNLKSLNGMKIPVIVMAEETIELER